MAKARTVMPPLLLLVLLPLAGCGNEVQEAYKKAYDANYPVGKQAGVKVGEKRGREEGTKKGQAAAREAAERGVAWQLYAFLGLGALSGGLGLGLCLQYSLLLAARRSGRVSQLSNVAFVPAMKWSLAYAVFERRRLLMLEVEEELREMARRRSLQDAQIQAVREAVGRKLKAVSSIEELTRARLLELASEEIARIVSGAAEKVEGFGEERPEADREERPEADRSPQAMRACPHCRQLIRYRARRAGATVNCPNPGCARPVKLEPPAEDDNMPLVFDLGD